MAAGPPIRSFQRRLRRRCRSFRRTPAASAPGSFGAPTTGAGRHREGPFGPPPEDPPVRSSDPVVELLRTTTCSNTETVACTGMSSQPHRTIREEDWAHKRFSGRRLRWVRWGRPGVHDGSAGLSLTSGRARHQQASGGAAVRPPDVPHLAVAGPRRRDQLDHGGAYVGTGPEATVQGPRQRDVAASGRQQRPRHDRQCGPA